MDLLKRENVQILECVANQEEAIRLSVQILEKDGYVDAGYKEAILSNMKEMGPYFVLTDKVALPHGRAEQGVRESQIAVTLFRQPVDFGNDKTGVQLFIALAAKDNEKHLKALAEIAELLQETETVNQILQSENVETLYKYFE